MNEHHYHVYVQIEGRKYRGGCAENWAAATHMLTESGCPTMPDHPPLGTRSDKIQEWQAGHDEQGLPTAGVSQVPGTYSQCGYNGPRAER